jgi:hypothetical protein
MVPEALARACAMLRSLAALARILAIRLSRLGAPIATGKFAASLAERLLEPPYPAGAFSSQREAVH